MGVAQHQRPFAGHDDLPEGGIEADSSFSGATTTLVNDPSLLPLVLPIAAGAVVGALLGVPLSGRLPAGPLRVGFTVLALVVAAGMAWKAL